MSMNTETLYRLLPAIYRIRDAKQGEPLKAWINVIAGQAEVLEEDIFRLYENWFIETCEERLVPYIGDLLGVRGLHAVDTESGTSLRSFVANTLRYRRRKGTATVLEQLAFDVTGWRARGVEFFELLETTQYFNHVRLHNVRTPDLRATNDLELLNSAFDKFAHSADVRHIDNDRGRHNIFNIGLFLWRLQSYPLHRVSAHQINGASSGRYTFSPLGNNMNLFNKPQTETTITHLAEEINVPALLRRRPLYDELENRRQTRVDGGTPECRYFCDQPNPVFEIFINGDLRPVPFDEVLICNLENWQTPPEKKTYKRFKDDGTYEDIEHPITVSADPVLGRLAFSDPTAVSEVKVSYAYGFSGDIGGGPYDRRNSVEQAMPREVDWQVGVAKEVPSQTTNIFNSLTEAIQEWNLQKAGSFGVIALLDNCTYEETVPSINIPEGSRLLIVATEWPETEKSGGLPGEKQRLLGQLDPIGLRPHLCGDLKVKGLAPENSLTSGKLLLNGLLVQGKISVDDGNLGGLILTHSTLVPEAGGLKVSKGNKKLIIELVNSISGPISIDAAIARLSVTGSIVDGSGTTKGIEAIDIPLELGMSTFFGEVNGLSIEASNCIFNDKLVAVRRQQGCVRFSYLPDGSSPPRCYHCQPEQEIAREISEAGGKEHLSKFKQDAIRMRVLNCLVPGYTSNRYGHHAYGQLSLNCPQVIRTGADNGSEMGVFNNLGQPQRESNLKSTINEYLRLGLEAGIIYVT